MNTLAIHSGLNPKRKPKPKKLSIRKGKPKPIMLKCEESLNDTRLPSKISAQTNALTPFITNLPDPITSSMKAILFDWLLQVSSQFLLQRITLHRSMTMINKYLKAKSITKQRFQLLGITALFISHKLEETQLIELQMFEEATNGGFSSDEILQMEVDVYLTLKWKVSVEAEIEVMWRVMRDWNQYVAETDYTWLGFAKFENKSSVEVNNLLDYLTLHNHKMDNMRLAIGVIYIYLEWAVGEEDRQVFKTIFNLFIKEHYRISVKQIQGQISALQFIVPSVKSFCDYFKTQPQAETIIEKEELQTEEACKDLKPENPPPYAIQTYTPYLSLYRQFLSR